MARVFGINGIKPYGIVVGRRAKSGFVRRSRYWQKCWAAKDEAEMIEILRREFQGETLKPVVIPCSDPETIAIDNNLHELEKKHILGSFNHEQGRIPQLMDKFSQVEFVRDNLGLNMAESFIINLADGDIPAGLPFPCLVKPVVSAEGNKSDIRKFDDRDSLREYFDVLREKGYTRILAQRFLDIDYEFCLSGCCGENISYLVSKTLRLWPNVGGTGSMLQIIDDEKIHEAGRNILRKIYNLGYSGLIDFDLFCVKDGNIYVGEINWRDSARVLMCMGTKVYYPLAWYWSVTGHPGKAQNIPLTTKDTSQYGMCEEADIYHVFHADPGFPRMSLREWLKDVRRAGSFAFWYHDDKLPALWGYLFKLVLSPIKQFALKLIGRK
ncbi:MAG: hypothetical protein IKQ95_02050 [Synergistaceae bacterium]|nr:hypothetical protein [Synergistaceae bacterium]